MRRLTRPRGARVAVVVTVLALGPAAVAAALRLPLINQLDWADAWFYSGYGWVPKHHFHVYGWTYFGVRFPAILPIGVFARVFGTYGGYVLLRYILAVASGVAVYLGVRRFAGTGVAVSTAFLLYLNPFFSRMLLWDYAGFAAVSAGVIGVALWWWSDERGLAWTLLPGAALASALFANALFGTALLVLAAVELVAATRTSLAACVRLAGRIVVAVLGGLIVFALGYVGYVAILGSFSPLDLVRPTIDFVRSNEQNSAMYQHPPSEWLAHEVRIWMPVVLSVAVASSLGRRLFGSDLRARVAQTAIGYTVLLWIYRATVTSSVVETWWAYALVVVALAPAIGVLLQEVATMRTGRRAWAAAAGVVIVVALAIRTFDGHADRLYSWIERHPDAVYALLGAGLACALLLLIRAEALRAASLCAVFALTTLMAWAPSVFDGRGTTGVFVRDWAADWHAYAAARSFVDLDRRYDSAQSHVYTWFPGTLGITNIAWAALPQIGTTVQLLNSGEPLDKLLPLGRARLRLPNAAYVLIMSPQPSDIPDAEHALAQNGFGTREVRTGLWDDGRLRYALLSLTSKPPS